MREERWQSLVVQALCDVMGVRPECVFAEVQTRDGSIADLVVLQRKRVIVFELKKAAPGEVGLGLGPRALRQLRHYALAADEVHLVTVGAPRGYEWLPGGGVVLHPPKEAQLLPPGVGWVAFDVLSNEAVIMSPAEQSQWKSADRNYLIDVLLTRLGRAKRAAQECRCQA